LSTTVMASVEILRPTRERWVTKECWCVSHATNCATRCPPWKSWKMSTLWL
jgi:hypothetical protein